MQGVRRCHIAIDATMRVDSAALAVVLALIFGGISLLDGHYPAYVHEQWSQIQSFLRYTGGFDAEMQDPELILADGSVLPRHVALEAAAQPVDAVIFRRVFTPAECDAIVDAVDLSRDGHLSSNNRETFGQQQPRTDHSTRRAKVAWLSQYGSDGSELEHGWVHRRVLEHVDVAVRKAQWERLLPTAVAQSAGATVAQIAHYPLPVAQEVERRGDGGGGGHYDWHIDMDVGFGSMAAAVASKSVNTTINGTTGVRYVGRRVSISVQLSPPEAYGGGRLELGNRHTVTTEQGSLAVFPAYLPHRVTRVTESSVNKLGVHAGGNNRMGEGRHSLVMWLSGPFGDGDGASAVRTAQRRLKSLHSNLQRQLERRQLQQEVGSLRSRAPCHCRCVAADSEELCRLQRLEGMLWVHLNESTRAADCFRAAVASAENILSCHHHVSSGHVSASAEVVTTKHAEHPARDDWGSECGCSGDRSLQLQSELDAAARKCAAQSFFGLGNLLSNDVEFVYDDQRATDDVLEALTMYGYVAKLQTRADEDGMRKAVGVLAASVCDRFEARVRESMRQEDQGRGNHKSEATVNSRNRWLEVQKACAAVAENRLSSTIRKPTE